MMVFLKRRDPKSTTQETELGDPLRLCVFICPRTRVLEIRRSASKS